MQRNFVRHPDLLTPAERRVFDFLAYGLHRRHLRAALRLSAGTIDTHIESIKAKMLAYNAEHLRRIAVAFRLRELDKQSQRERLAYIRSTPRLSTASAVALRATRL